jgi:outer membrane biosynthesis protein TonB
VSDYNCPFCESEITEELGLYGGRCPNCFGDIPGEEAATDPGEAVKMSQAAADARRAKFKVIAPLVFALPVLAVLVGFSVFQVIQPEPELEVMDLDSLEFAMPEMDSLLIAADVEEEKTTKSRSRSRSKRKRGSAGIQTANLSSGETSADDAALLAGLGGDATADADELRGPRSVGAADAMPDFLSKKGTDSMETEMSASVDSLGQNVMAVNKTRLKDVKRIQQMVLRVLQRQLPALRTCYESRLRADSSLSGKWTLHFSVTSEGKVSGPRAVGHSTRDAMFEKCLANKMARWRFQPIEGELPFKKAVTFDRN